MKKILLAAGLLMMTAAVTFAHNTIGGKERKEIRKERKETRKEHRMIRRAENRNEVSDLTQRQFSRDFQDAVNVSFERTTNYDEVMFMSGNQKLKAYYDYASNLIGTTQKQKFADLPEVAKKEILEKYPGYKVSGVIKFDDNENNDIDMFLYGSNFDDADNYFVELKKDTKAIVLKSDLSGNVSFFKDIK